MARNRYRRPKTIAPTQGPGAPLQIVTVPRRADQLPFLFETAQHCDTGTAGEYRHDGSIVNLCGDDADLRATMSLENQVRDGLPPFFVWHTVEDPSVPVQNSLMLAGALTAHKVPLELHLFAHDGHGTSTCTREVNTPNKHNSAWVALCTDWLAETFDFHL